MKKFFLSLAAAVTFGFSAQAQVTVIPKIGMTFSNIATKEDIGQKSASGFLIGAGLNFGRANGFSFQPELLYIQKGFSGLEDQANFTYRRSYLELPLLTKFSFGTETVKGYINAGPSIGYALSQKVSSNGFSVGLDFDDSANRAELAVQLGGGVSFQAGPGSIVLDVRYGHGLTNLSKDASPNAEDNKLQNRTLAISLGYAIPLGGK